MTIRTRATPAATNKSDRDRDVEITVRVVRSKAMRPLIKRTAVEQVAIRERGRHSWKRDECVVRVLPGLEPLPVQEAGGELGYQRKIPVDAKHSNGRKDRPTCWGRGALVLDAARQSDDHHRGEGNESPLPVAAR